MCALQIAGNGGACCDCPQLNGCDCGGIACALVCESKSGTALLCGFEEFVASLPPKFYRRKTIAGIMYGTRWDDAGCPAGDGGDAQVTLDFTASPFGVETHFQAQISFSRVDPANPSFVYYKLDSLSPAEIDGVPGATTSIIIRRGGFAVGNSTPGTEFADSLQSIGDTFDMELHVQFSGMQGETLFVAAGVAWPRQQRDNWQIERHYAANDADCTDFQTDTNTSQRFEKYQENILDSGGVEVVPPAGFFTINGPAYGSFAEPGALEATRRETLGTTDCEDIGDGFSYRYQGTVTEELFDEDTDQNAEDRALAAIGAWSPCAAGCPTCSTFRVSRAAGQDEFTFRKQRAKVTWLAEVDKAYKITVRFARRILGSSGPFVFYASQELTVVADTVNEETDWVDVPNETGWETIPANCSVCRLTSGGEPSELCP